MNDLNFFLEFETLALTISIWQTKVDRTEAHVSDQSRMVILEQDIDSHMRLADIHISNYWEI